MKRHPVNDEYSEIILDGNKMVGTKKRKYKEYTVVYDTKFSCENNQQDANFQKKYGELVIGYVALLPDWELKELACWIRRKELWSYFFGESRLPVAIPSF